MNLRPVEGGGLSLSIERVRWFLGGAAAALLFALIAVPAARADFSTLYGGDVSCATQAANGNVRLCAGETTTWDGATKIDLNVVLPPPPGPGMGEEAPYPVIGLFHGWGGEKIGLEEPRGPGGGEKGGARSPGAPTGAQTRFCISKEGPPGGGPPPGGEQPKPPKPRGSRP